MVERSFEPLPLPPRPIVRINKQASIGRSIFGSVCLSLAPSTHSFVAGCENRTSDLIDWARRESRGGRFRNRVKASQLRAQPSCASGSSLRRIEASIQPRFQFN